MKPKILVLGGSGFVGRAVVRELCRGGHAVRATLRGSESAELDGAEDVEWVRVDLENQASIRAALQGCVAVIHAAGYEPELEVSVAEARQRGVGELRAVLDECLAQGVLRIVYVSSVSTMNSGDRARVYEETDFYTPGQYDDAYFEAKYSMEAELYRYFDKGLEIVVALPSLTLGPGCLDSPARAVLENVLKDSGAHKTPDEQEGSKRRLNVVDVRDVARALVAAMERGRAGRRYALGGINTDLSRVRELLAQVLDENGVTTEEFLGERASSHFIANLAEKVSKKVSKSVVEKAAGTRAGELAHKLSGYVRDPLTARQGLGAIEDFSSDQPPWYGVHVNSQRARGELGHRPALLAQTLAASINSGGQE